MNKNSKKIFISLVLFCAGCVSRVTSPSISSPSISFIEPTFAKTATYGIVEATDEFSIRRNSFGDGFIAHISKTEVDGDSKEEIINLLLGQLLDHYKMESSSDLVAIVDYRINDIDLSVKAEKNDPDIVAYIDFSIIPFQVPNDWASFPKVEIHQDDPWWDVGAIYGVYSNANYYWLKLLIGHGT